MKPASATIKMRTPRIMIGHCRNFMQESAGPFVSQIPAPIIGIERTTAIKFMPPITLLLIAIFFLLGRKVK